MRHTEQKEIDGTTAFALRNGLDRANPHFTLIMTGAITCPAEGWKSVAALTLTTGWTTSDTINIIVTKVTTATKCQAPEAFSENNSFDGYQHASAGGERQAP
jgi:hypothetical protein